MNAYNKKNIIQEQQKKAAIHLNEAEYIAQRLDDQIEWYSNKSSEAQKKYKILQRAEIIIAATTPVLGCVALAFEKVGIFLTIVMSALGSIIATIEAICKMNKYHENWIQYRYISELLKHEKYLFITKTPPYDDESAFSLLVQRVERTISSENVNWVGINENENYKDLVLEKAKSSSTGV